MTTYFVTVSEKRVRAVTTTKGIVIAENEAKALEVVKNHYPAGATGWKPDAEFKVVEMQTNRFFPV